MNSNSGLMDGLGNFVLVNKSLKSSIQKSLNVKTKDVIETVFSFLIK